MNEIQLCLWFLVFPAFLISVHITKVKEITSEVRGPKTTLTPNYRWQWIW